MREQNWLGALQMSISRHDKIDMFRGETQERLLQFLKLARRPTDSLFDVKPQIERDLIVATPGGMELRTGGVDFFCERALDIHVHVFKRFIPDKFPGIDFLFDLHQTALDLLI